MIFAQVPPPDVMNDAWRGIVEFGIIGAVLVVILGGFISLVWWDRKTSRKREEGHSKALSNKDDLHREERIELRESIDSRLSEYRILMADKDKAMQDMQTEHVKQVKAMVTAVVKSDEKANRVLDKLDAVLNILIDSSRGGDAGE